MRKLGGARPGAGRKRLPDAEKKTPLAALRVPLRPADRDRLDRAAQEAGMPTATWARMVLLREAGD